jgi:hypothetical protein
VSLERARLVADAVLYEGYLLYPYRATSAKNQVRWQFGVLGPDGAAQAGHGEEPELWADLLFEPLEDPHITVLLRFLHVQERTVQRWDGEDWCSVEALTVGAARWIPFHEAVPCELRLDLPFAAAQVPVAVDGENTYEDLYDGGALVGRLVRTRWPLDGLVTLEVQPGAVAVARIGVRNRTAWQPTGAEGWSDRDVAARASFVGTHLLVQGLRAGCRSVIDPPEHAPTCRQYRCWPGLISTDDGTDAFLVAPIVLGDHPAVAPETSGDLFDATEIDEILTLRVLTLTDDERAQARGTDPRAAAILDRCEGLTEGQLTSLHGTWRDGGMHEGVSPETDSVLVGDVPVSKGSRVLLRPQRRADAQDMFLAGLTAVVERVYHDLDGGTHLAVRLEDDPGADLYATTGRFYYFAPDEVEPLVLR